MIAALLAGLSLVAPARADVVVLANGMRMHGIVLEQEGDELELQVDDEGFVQLSSPTVARVEKEGAKKNAALKAQWRARNAKAAAAEEKDRAFTDAQRAKGLIFYEGEWMKPAEAEHRLAAKRLQAETHDQQAKVYMPDERTPNIPAPQTTVTAPVIFPFLPLPVQHPFPQARGRVFVFKDGHAVEKRGRVIDLSGD